MKRFLMDTNIYTHAFKGDPEVVSILRGAEEIGICGITMGELLFGFKAGSREDENRKELDEFLDAPRVRLYGLDETTAEFYAATLFALKKVGKPIPTNDIWIASVAFQHGLPLFTKDRHFENIPGLVLVRTSL
jgi:tRNA(fMet)-specific endonuclease VapC